MNGVDRDVETIKLILFYGFFISGISSVKKITPLIDFWR